MEYLTLFVLAALGQSGSGRTWREWRGHAPAYPGRNHHFDYNTWCHSAGGWPGHKESWEDSSFEESQWNENKWTRTPTRTTRTKVTERQSPATTISTRAGTEEGPSNMELLVCLRACPITPEYNPVCGSDGITYWNPGRIQCAIACGVDVTLFRPSMCSSSNLESTTSSSTTTIPSPQVLAACMRSCPATSEYNPICGTDNITYLNPSRLECARSCGKPVTVRVTSRCPPPDQINESTSTTTFTTASSTTTSARPTKAPDSGSGTTDYTISPDLLNAIFNGHNITSTTTEDINDFSLDVRVEE